MLIKNLFLHFLVSERNELVIFFFPEEHNFIFC